MENNMSTELHEAADKGDLVKVKALAEERSSTSYHRYKSSFRRDGKLRMPLLSTTCDESRKQKHTENNMSTELHETADNHDLVKVKRLAKKGFFSLHSNNKDIYTPSLSAACSGRLAEVRHLVKDFKVNPNIANKEGNTLLHGAVYNGHIEIVRYLVEECKANPNAADINGNTPLHKAAYIGHLEIVRYLVEECKVNPNIANKYGKTPAHWAADGEWSLNGKHLATVRYLVEQAKADVMIKDNEGKTVLEVAKDDEDIRGFLEKYILGSQLQQKPQLTSQIASSTASSNQLASAPVSTPSATKDINKTPSNDSQAVQQEVSNLSETEIVTETEQNKLKANLDSKIEETLQSLQLAQDKSGTKSLEDWLQKLSSEQQRLSKELEQQHAASQALERKQQQRDQKNNVNNTSLVELQQRVITVTQTCQELMYLQQINRELLQLSESFKQHPNLFVFFRQFQISLENFFVASKVFGTNMGTIATRETLGNAAFVGKVFAKLLGLIPCVGNMLESGVSLFAKSAAWLDRVRQVNALKTLSELGSIDELKFIAQETACRVTQHYERYIRSLSTQEEIAAQQAAKQTSGLGATAVRAKKTLLKEKSYTPAETLANYGVALLCSALLEDGFGNSKQSGNTLIQQFIQILSQEPSEAQRIKTSLYQQIGLQMIQSRYGEWSLQAIFCERVSCEPNKELPQSTGDESSSAVVAQSACNNVLGDVSASTISNASDPTVENDLGEQTRKIKMLEQQMADMQARYQAELKQRANELAQLREEQGHMKKLIQKNFSSEIDLAIGEGPQLQLQSQLKHQTQPTAFHPTAFGSPLHIHEILQRVVRLEQVTAVHQEILDTSGLQNGDVSVHEQERQALLN
jgi:hypothetical protein